MKFFFFNSGLSTVVAIALMNIGSCQKHQDHLVINISGFTPAQGIVGDAITINGNNFSTITGNNNTSFNGAAANVTNATATSLTVEVPQGATTGKIAVTVNGSTATSSSDFIVTSIDLSTLSGAIGKAVTIMGNFDATPTNNVVKFNGVAAAVTNASATQLIAVVPYGATSGYVTVSVNGVTVISSSPFTVVSAWTKKTDYAGGSRH